jgi:antitoxin component HigA of HigAB toxin-antitoxin module
VPRHVLMLLIENFEEKKYALPKASPIDAILFLMGQHGLKQKDLTDVFGTPSTGVSGIQLYAWRTHT